MLDVTKFVGEVHDYISRALNPLVDRIKALESRAPVPGERGADGAPGKDGERGLPGADGRDGAPGKDGIDGKDGRDGKDADPIDMADVTRELLAHPGLKSLVDLLVAEAVQAHFAANPVQHGKDGRDGRDGLPGKDGERGPPGADGAKGEPGEDGVGMAGGMIDVNGELILTTTKGDTLRLGKVVGKDGANGADGIGFDDLSFDYDGEREFSIKASKDGRVKEAKFTVPTVIDRGYWREGVKAKSGDGWTEGGHWWICKADTDSRPGHDNPAWRMGARAGKDRDTVRAKPAGGPVKLMPADEE